MNRVLDRLWVGGSSDLDSEVPLAALGFVAVVDARDGQRPQVPGVEVHRLANRDGDPWSPDALDAAYDFIASRIRRGRVLVACAAGMSRSVSLAAGYLSRVGYDAPTAFEAVRAARPQARPVAAMLDAALASAVESREPRMAVVTGGASRT